MQKCSNPGFDQSDKYLLGLPEVLLRSKFFSELILWLSDHFLAILTNMKIFSQDKGKNGCVNNFESNLLFIRHGT